MDKEILRGIKMEYQLPDLPRKTYTEWRDPKFYKVVPNRWAILRHNLGKVKNWIYYRFLERSIDGNILSYHYEWELNLTRREKALEVSLNNLRKREVDMHRRETNTVKIMNNMVEQETDND